MPEQSAIPTLHGLIAPLLQCDSVEPDMIDFCSLWMPRQWKKSTPYFIDEQYLPPTNSANLNQDIRWEIAKMAHGINRLDLRIVTPQQTIAPLGSTAYFADWLGWAMTERFDLIYGCNQVYHRENWDLYFKMRREQNIELQLATADLERGDLSQAQRQADLVNGEEVYVNFMVPFELLDACMCPLVTLTNKFTVIWKSFPVNYWITTIGPATTVTALADYTFELILSVVRTTGDESGYLLALSQEDDGIAYMVHQGVRQTSDTIANVTNGYKATIKLSGITKPLRLLSFALIPDRLTNHTGYNDIFMFDPQPSPLPAGMINYAPIQQMGIDTAGMILWRTMYNKYNRVLQYSEFMNGLSGESIFFQTYTRYPTSANVAAGYADYTVYSVPVLTILFGVGGTGIDPLNPPAPQVLRVIIIGEDYNFWFFKLGNWTLSLH